MKVNYRLQDTYYVSGIRMPVVTMLYFIILMKCLLLFLEIITIRTGMFQSVFPGMY